MLSFLQLADGLQGVLGGVMRGCGRQGIGISRFDSTDSKAVL